MIDYETIKDLELSSYESLGGLTEDSSIATSNLSNAMSAIYDNLANMLDKRDENSIVSGSVEISGTLSTLSDITTSSDIHAFRHGLIGKDVDFSTGGDEVLVVGHEHKIYGKESFVAGNEGNIIGAKAFHWKAIDTTNNLIYLTHEQTKFNSDQLSSSQFLSGSSGNFITYDQYKKYDIPYFGPRLESYLSDDNNASCLFKVDNQISILKDDVQISQNEIIPGAVGKTLILNNVQNIPYFRKLIVEDVLSGSILSVRGLDTIEPSYQQTHYRKNKNHTYHGNYYFVCFQDVPDISTYTDGGWEKNMTFGCAALGENNCTIGYNSFAIGKDNITEGNYSIALGYNAKAGNNGVFVWSGNGAYNVSGEGQFGINPKSGISGFYIGNKTLDYYLKNLSGDLNSEISNKLDKRNGGTISGNVEVFQHDIKILSGNYIQVTNGEKAYNYSQKNAFIQAEEAFNGDNKSYGPACTGTLGYCILSVVNGSDKHGFKLSGDISKLVSLMSNDVVGAGIKYDPKNGCSKTLSTVLGNTSDISNAFFSLALDNQGESLKYQISSIDEANNIIYVKQAFSSGTAKLSTLTEDKCISLWTDDDNAFYVPGFPELGNAVIKNFYAQHVEGGSSRAVGKYTHAEGRDNIADVRYSHVEGSHNIAASMASHAEGFQNKVTGKYAHVEGNLNTVAGDFSHAEGQSTNANGQASHAEGQSTNANGQASHASGIKASTNAAYSYVWNGRSTHNYNILSNNVGTFNINPVNGLAGIYIGHHSLAEMSLPVSNLSTTVIYNDGTVSTLAIENNLLSSSIPNKSKVIDITIGNSVKNIEAGAFKGFTSLTNVIIPNSVSAIQNQAFYQCSGLTGISFPDSVLTIDYSAMSKCSNLRTVKLPNNLQKLTDWTFYQCSSLVDVHIPNSIYSIGKQCFESCSNLVHVNVPDAVSSIGLSAFLNCTNLTGVEFEYRTNEEISSIAKYSSNPIRWGIRNDDIIIPYDWNNTTGYFNINPKNEINGFYIGQRSLSDIISTEINSAQGHSDAAINQLKGQISSAISTITSSPLSSLNISSNIEDVINSIVDIRNMLSSLYDVVKN